MDEKETTTIEGVGNDIDTIEGLDEMGGTDSRTEGVVHNIPDIIEEYTVLEDPLLLNDTQGCPVRMNRHLTSTQRYNEV